MSNQLVKIKHVREYIQSLAPWSEKLKPPLLPCEKFPLFGGDCACSSPSRVLELVNGSRTCPFNGIEGCPMQSTPDS